MKDNISSSPKKGFYAQVVTKGTVGTSQLCEEIAGSCTLAVSDMKAAIEALTDSVSKKLMDGYNVCIDELGTFSLSAESLPVERPDELRSQSVKVKKINFRPSVRLKNSMKRSRFERIKNRNDDVEI
jgi:predicted histone-like DNA-binding protein